jgi:hypothetical protein
VADDPVEEMRAAVRYRRGLVADHAPPANAGGAWDRLA